MKERPIIMNAESVRAILDGRKTQTRRVDKINQNFWPEVGLDQDGKLFDVGYGDFQDKCHVEHLCPYGKIGNRLWVRETWAEATPYPNSAVYKATYEYPQDFTHDWKSPIFMPRWASRITLEITDIRVERLQDITGEDAIAEGMPIPYVSRDEYEPISMYRELWQKLNAKRGYPWESNPWVWVIEFKVI